VAYLALTQATLAALAIVAVFAPKNYAWKVSLAAAAAWYVTQAVDEWLAGNLFSDAMAEYVVFLLYCIGIILHLRAHDAAERTA